jgi:hypothetical protein
VLTFSDATGDASPEAADGVPAVSPADDPSLDIVKMRIEGTPSGIRATMWLAGPYTSDGVYWARLTDARTGCRLDIDLGGANPDGAFLTCPGGSSTLISNVNTADPSYTELVAVVPYRLLPEQLSPRDRFTKVSGLTQPNPQGQRMGDADSATTSKTIGPFL